MPIPMNIDDMGYIIRQGLWPNYLPLRLKYLRIILPPRMLLLHGSLLLAILKRVPQVNLNYAEHSRLSKLNIIAALNLNRVKDGVI